MKARHSAMPFCAPVRSPAISEARVGKMVALAGLHAAREKSVTFEAAAIAISDFWCCIFARPGRLGRRGDVMSLRKAIAGASPAMALAFELGSAVAEDQAKRGNGLIVNLETL